MSSLIVDKITHNDFTKRAFENDNKLGRNKHALPITYIFREIISLWFGLLSLVLVYARDSQWPYGHEDTSDTRMASWSSLTLDRLNLRYLRHSLRLPGALITRPWRIPNLMPSGMKLLIRHWHPTYLVRTLGVRGEGSPFYWHGLTYLQYG